VKSIAHSGYGVIGENLIMRYLICSLVICVLPVFQIGCCNFPGKGTWNDNVSGLWSWRSGATTAPESATFANQGLYLGQQSRYISPPSSDPVATVPTEIIAPLPNVTPTSNPVIPSANNTIPTAPTNSPTPVPIPTPIPQPASTIPTPTPNLPYADPFGANAVTVPATPTITELPANYLASATPIASTATKPQDTPLDFTAPRADVALPASPFANNVNAAVGSIGSPESLFAPTQSYGDNNKPTSTNLPNVAPINNNPNQTNTTPPNANVPLTAYEIAAAGTAETAYQSIKTRTGTQIKTSQNGVTTVTTASALPVTSYSHFVTEISSPE
jgi:hypothetical protein